MILGFLGKGGSGKSSLSSQMALFLNKEQRSVLAVDADHNMDLSYNLTAGNMANVSYFGESLPDFQAAVGLASNQKYTEAFLTGVDTRFSLTPLSAEIDRYSSVLGSGIRLMTAGKQTDSVLYGKACSHILSTTLKILLPLLTLEPGEFAVVDEKAGADGASTGIVTGIDVGVIVCEPALHSVKAAQQIAELMRFYDTPYMFVGNKVASAEDEEFIVSQLGEKPVAFMAQSNSIKRDPSGMVNEWSDSLRAILEIASQKNKNDRLARTTRKFKRNDAFVRG